MLYLNENDRANPMFTPDRGFFGRDLNVPDRIAQMALSLQDAEQNIRALKVHIRDIPAQDESNATLVEATWRQIANSLLGITGAINPPLDGESAGAPPSERATEVATNSPSRKPLKQKA